MGITTNMSGRIIGQFVVTETRHYRILDPGDGIWDVEIRSEDGLWQPATRQDLLSVVVIAVLREALPEAREFALRIERLDGATK